MIAVADQGHAENAQRMAEASSCLLEGKFECALDLYIEEMSDEQRGLFSPGTPAPSVLGTRVEYALGMVSGEVEAAKQRGYSETLLASVVSEQPETPFFLFAIHLSRWEACEKLGDLACSNESQTFICGNSKRLAAPYFAEHREDLEAKLAPRVRRVFAECEDT